MYHFDTRVRFSETDKERKLTMEAIVDYFQDCSTFQTEDMGIGFSYLLPKNLTWVLLKWQIIVDEYPSLGEEISICTIPYDFRGYFEKRNFFIVKNGKLIAKADTLWTILNIEKMMPEKISEEISSAYPKEDKIEMEYLSRKITISGVEEAKNTLIISKHHLDCNNHVNNGQYIKIASVYLPEDFVIYQMRVEYRNQAHLNDVIYPYVYKEDNKVIVCLCDELKKPYTLVEFQKNK